MNPIANKLITGEWDWPTVDQMIEDFVSGVAMGGMGQAVAGIGGRMSGAAQAQQAYEDAMAQEKVDAAINNYWDTVKQKGASSGEAKAAMQNASDALAEAMPGKAAAGRAALNMSFEQEFTDWLDTGTEAYRLNDRGRFLIGTTSEKLHSAGVDNYDIYFGKSKIAKIMKNPEMTADVIKAAVKVVENPVVVMDSKTVPGSITMFGDAKTAGGKPVMVSLLLHPETRTGEILDYGIVTSTYGRRTSNAQSLIDRSNIRWVETDKKRTDEWSKELRLQLPSSSTTLGSNDTVSQIRNEVKTEGVLNNGQNTGAGQGNGLDALGAGGEAGGVSAERGAAPGTDAGGVGEVRPGVGEAGGQALRQVTPAQLGIKNGSATVAVEELDIATLSEGPKAQAERLTGLGLTPHAIRGQMLIGEAETLGYVQGNDVFFHVDAVDGRGRTVTAKQVVDHELYHKAVERNRSLVAGVYDIIRARTFAAMRERYKRAYAKIADFSAMTEEQIEAYLAEEIGADAYAGMNDFAAQAETQRTAQDTVAAAQTDAGQMQTEAQQDKLAPPEGRAAVLIGKDDIEGKEDRLAAAYDTAMTENRGVEIPKETLDNYKSIYTNPEESLIEAVKAYYEESLKGNIVQVEMNEGVLEIMFENDGKKKSVGWRMKPTKAATFEKLKEMTERAVYAYSEQNRDAGERDSVPFFHYFVNNARVAGRDIPIKIQVRDVITGKKTKETHYYTHTLEKNSRDRTGPVAGIEDPNANIDSNANLSVSTDATLPHSGTESKSENMEKAPEGKGSALIESDEEYELSEYGETTFTDIHGGEVRVSIQQQADGSYNARIDRDNTFQYTMTGLTSKKMAVQSALANARERYNSDATPPRRGLYTKAEMESKAAVTVDAEDSMERWNDILNDATTQTLHTEGAQTYRFTSPNGNAFSVRLNEYADGKTGMTLTVSRGGAMGKQVTTGFFDSKELAIGAAIASAYGEDGGETSAAFKAETRAAANRIWLAAASSCFHFFPCFSYTYTARRGSCRYRACGIWWRFGRSTAQSWGGRR